MRTQFTLKHIQDLQKAGKIRGYTLLAVESTTEGKTGAKKGNSKKGQKIKGWIELNLWYWCKVNGYHLLKEQAFDEVRKWRFDFFICGLRVAIEYNGIMSEKSRHTTVTGYTGDMNKINAAQRKGIKVLQFTPLNYKQLITELEKIK